MRKLLVRILRRQQGAGKAATGVRIQKRTPIAQKAATGVRIQKRTPMAEKRRLEWLSRALRK
jgi:hypothetical protein